MCVESLLCPPENMSRITRPRLQTQSRVPGYASSSGQLKIRQISQQHETDNPNTMDSYVHFAAGSRSGEMSGGRDAQMVQTWRLGLSIDREWGGIRTEG